MESWPDLDVAPVGQSGVCGWNARVSVDYNQPGASWGTAPVQTFAPGDTIEVQWCVDANGDHGGMFTYRLCQDQSIVDKFLTPGYLPTSDEKQAAEECFEAGLLPCTDVSGQTCDFSPDCTSDQPCWDNQWFTCDKFGDGGCEGVDGAALNSCPTTIAGGYTVTKKVQLPSNFTSDHTLLSFKWNSFQTGQIYLSCSDIAISGSAAPGGGSPAPSPSSPAPAPTQPSTTLSTSVVATPPASTAPAGGACGVSFQASVTAPAGSTIEVAGSIQAFGEWDTGEAVALTSSGSSWTGTVPLAAGTTFEYKYIQVGSDGTVTWEADPNRSFTVPETCDSAVAVTGTWQT